MSYAICRIDKCSSSHDITGIQIHDRRERKHSNSNPDIDFERSSLNYSLCSNADNSSFNSYIDQQIAERYTGKKAIRKDAVRMVQVLFTSDTEFFSRITAEQQREYFQSCYEWASKRWGSNNIISADVHLDEQTPHMHLNFVPLTADGRLSAKECVGNGSKALQQLQDDFYKTVGKPYGLERGSRADLENGEKPRRHQKVAEYKADTNYYLNQAKDALNSLKKETETLSDEFNALQTAYNALQANIDILNAQKHQWEEERSRERFRLFEREQQLHQHEKELLAERKKYEELPQEVKDMIEFDNYDKLNAKLLAAPRWAERMKYALDLVKQEYTLEESKKEKNR